MIWAVILQAAAASNKAIASYYDAITQKNALKSQALSLDFAAQMDDLNARGAETEAQQILDAGNQQIGVRGMVNAQAKAEERVSQAARGVQMGVGSAAEVQASIQLAKEMDTLTIGKNVAAASGAKRMERVNYQNRAMIGRVSARNVRNTARSINPWMAAGTSLLGSAASMGSSFGGGGGG